MVKAVWNGQVLAESDRTIEMEGNQYFPPDSVRRKFLKPSKQTSVCPWKGTAVYYDIEVDGKVNEAAAWLYPTPSDAAARIKDHVVFWKGVAVG